MTAAQIPLAEQALEAELHSLGIRELHTRAAAGKIKRSPHYTERLATRAARAEAAALTLKALAKGGDR